MPGTGSSSRPLWPWLMLMFGGHDGPLTVPGVEDDDDPHAGGGCLYCRVLVELAPLL